VRLWGVLSVAGGPVSRRGVHFVLARLVGVWKGCDASCPHIVGGRCGPFSNEIVWLRACVMWGC
jgi:hypothetical protein